MTRVLMVIRAGEGGAFTHVVQLAGALHDHGHTVAICGPHRHDATGPVPVLPLEMAREIAPAADLRGVAALARITRTFRPDIVHAHGNKGGVLARLGHLVNRHVPIVYSPHGYAFAGHFEAGERSIYRGLEGLVGPIATRVLCVCEAEARLAARVGPRSRIRVVHNGIQRDHAIAAALGPGAAAPRLCAVAGLRPGKGVDTLLEAMVPVLRAHPGCRLAIAGGGAEGRYLKAVATCNGVAGSVDFLGSLDDVNPLLETSDLFVGPSWAESFPYSILEAMSFGLPIVATAVGGVPEAIEDGVTGTLVPPQDAQALGQALIGLLDDPARARALGVQARERQRARFSLDRMVAGTLGVYDEVLPATGTASPAAAA